jgi:transposase
MLILLVSGFLDRLIFIDETATYTYIQPVYGYSRCGQRMIVRTKTHPNRYTLIGVMRIGGMLAPKVFPRAMTDKDWVEWIKSDFIPPLEPASIVIMDNLNIHGNLEALKALEDAGHTVLFQSRYNPDLKPIEKAWSKIKTLLRQMRPCGADQLGEAIVQAWKEITTKDINSYLSCTVDNAWNLSWQLRLTLF